MIRSTIRRMGKTCEALVDALEAAGGAATIGDLAVVLGVKRPRDLRRRAVARLEAAEVVECSGDNVRLRADWLAALNRERDLAGEVEAMRRDMARYEREREAYRNRHRIRADPLPEREPDGLIGDLEPLPPERTDSVAHFDAVAGDVDGL